MAKVHLLHSMKEILCLLLDLHHLLWDDAPLSHMNVNGVQSSRKQNVFPFTVICLPL